MDTLQRSVRNVFRGRARSLFVILILSLSVATLVTLTQIAAGISNTTNQLRAELETLIEVRAAGSTGMGRGADPLLEGIVEQISPLPNIVEAEKYTFSRNENPDGEFPVWVLVGMEPGKSLRVNSHGEVGTPTVYSGREFTPDDLGKAVAIAGILWAEEYEARTGQAVEVGTRLTIEGTSIVAPAEVEIVGLYEAGFVFGDSQIIVPLPLAQQMLDETGLLTNVFVTVDSLENVITEEDMLRETLGPEVDVLAGREKVRVLSQGLGSIQANVNLSATLITIGGALIVLLTMVLVTRERTWEIGMLKAIGASNGDVARQFIFEALALGLISVGVGLLIFAIAGPWLGNLFLSLTNFAVPVAIPGFSEQTATQLEISYRLSLPTLLRALGIALLFGGAGSLYPIWRALRLHPAEALRYL